MRYALAVGVLLAIGQCGNAISAKKPLRLAQNQTSFACINNCNTQSALCSNRCSQNTATINALNSGAQVSSLQNQQPIQCQLNCTTQQQACYATCR